MENQSHPSIFILTDYVKSIYSKLLDYTTYFGKMTEGEEPEAYLNKVIDFAFSHNPKSLFKLFEKKTDTAIVDSELYMYFLSLLKRGLPASTKINSI